MRWRFALPVFCVAAFAWLALALPAGATGVPNTCVVQRWSDVQPPPVPPDADGARLQNIATQLRGSAEGVLGAQDGGVWLTAGRRLFVLGLAPGPISVQGAQQTIDALLDHDLSASDAVFAKPRFEVVAVPNTWARLLADSSIFTQVQRVIANPSAVSTGIMAPPYVPFPQLVVVLNNAATDRDCAAALSVVQSYGNAAVLVRLNIAPAIPLIDRLTTPKPPHPRQPVKTQHTRQPGARSRPINAVVDGYLWLCGGPVPGRCYIEPFGYCTAPQGCVSADRVIVSDARGRRVAQQQLHHARFHLPLRPGSYTIALLGDGSRVHGRVMQTKKITVAARHTAIVRFSFAIS